MKLMESVYAFYLTQAAMTSLFKLWDTEAPPKESYPYATYSLPSQTADYSMDQEFENCLVQFNLYSEQSSPSQLESMFEALKNFDFCAISVPDYTTLIMERMPAIRTRVEEIWQYAVTYRVRLEKT